MPTSQQKNRAKVKNDIDEISHDVDDDDEDDDDDDDDDGDDDDDDADDDDDSIWWSVSPGGMCFTFCSSPDFN